MTAFIENLFFTIFGENSIIATILISMIPVIELKGAIPFATSSEIWGNNALTLWQSYGYALLGSSLVVPLLALIYAPLIKWFKSTKLFRNLAVHLEHKVNSKKDDIEKNIDESIAKNIVKKKDKKWLKILGVFIFVAVPLPFTGVWTGTCIAVALGLNFWISCITVILGNAVAGGLITLITMFFGDQSLIFFYILIDIVLLCLIFMMIKFIVKRVKQNRLKNVYNEDKITNENSDEKVNTNTDLNNENTLKKNNKVVVEILEDELNTTTREVIDRSETIIEINDDNE